MGIWLEINNSDLLLVFYNCNTCVLVEGQMARFVAKNLQSDQVHEL